MQYILKALLCILTVIAVVGSCSNGFLIPRAARDAAVREDGAPRQAAFAGYRWLPEEEHSLQHLVERGQVYVTQSKPQATKTVEPLVTPKATALAIATKKATKKPEKVQKVKKTVVVTAPPKVIVKPTEVVVTVTAVATVTKTPTPTPVHVTVTALATEAVTVTASVAVAAVSVTQTPIPQKVICRFWMKNCNIQEINRQICFTGENIDQFTCEQIGCCWQPIKSQKAPTCYRAIWAPVCNLQCNFQAYLTGGQGVSETPLVKATSAKTDSTSDAPSGSSNTTQTSQLSSGNVFSGLQNALSGLPSS
jgi:hypothetical protein